MDSAIHTKGHIYIGVPTGINPLKNLFISSQKRLKNNATKLLKIKLTKKATNK